MHAAEIDGELAIDEGPQIVVPLELKRLPAIVLELSLLHV
jgi:hypothetical protein